MPSKLLLQLTFYLLVLLSGSHVFQLRHTTRDTAGKGEEEGGSNQQKGSTGEKARLTFVKN